MITQGPAALEVEQTYARARSVVPAGRRNPPALSMLCGLCTSIAPRGALPTARELGKALPVGTMRGRAGQSLLEAHDQLDTPYSTWVEYVATRHTSSRRSPSLTRRRSTPWRSATTRRLGWHCLALAGPTLWCLGYSGTSCAAESGGAGPGPRVGPSSSLAEAQYWAAFLSHHRREVPAVQAQAAALLTLATAQGFPAWKGLGPAGRAGCWPCRARVRLAWRSSARVCGAPEHGAGTVADLSVLLAEAAGPCWPG